MTGSDSLQQALRSGVQAFEAGDLAVAAAAFRRATSIAPGHAGARNLLGVALIRTGQLPAAISELEQAARLAKNDAAILGNLAQAYHAAGRDAEALQLFRKAGRIDPQNPNHAQGAAISLARQGQFAEAARILQRLTARFPDTAAPWYNLGNVQRSQQHWADAERCYREALRIAPADSDARLNLGSVLHSQLRFAEAEAEYRKCIAATPGHVAARLNLVSVLIDDGRNAQAEIACRELLALDPGLPEAHRFLAAALSHQGKATAALPEYAHAAALAPGDPATQRAYGGALAEAGDLHRALRILHQASRLEPDAAALHQLQSALFLAHGLYAEGWSAYRQRPAFLRFAEKLGPGTLTQALPADLAGKHVAVLREQGLGDELFFLRYLPALKTLGAKVTVRASDRIAGMLARAACADAIAPDATADIRADLQILCGDLPGALQRFSACAMDPAPEEIRLRDFAIAIRAQFPPLAPTLRIPALADAVEPVRNRLHTAGLPPYLGVTWRAGTAARDQDGAHWALSKEVPLEALAHCLRGFPGTLLALQRKPAPDEIRNFSALCGSPVHDFTDLNDDLEQMLALLELIDDYVGVSNTNMHLRAATGRAARVLVPNPPEWRWFAGGRSSPWFPEFVVYRQSLNGAWDSLSALAADLHHAVAGRT